MDSILIFKMSKTIRKLFVFMSVLAMCACLPNQKENQLQTSKDPPFNLLDFQSSKKLPLGQALCFIEGSKNAPFSAPYPGVIKLNIAQSKTSIKKGFIWGAMSAEEINNEIKAHLEQKNNLDSKEKHYEEFEKPKEILQLEKELNTAKERLKNFELIYKEMDQQTLNELIPDANQLIELDPEAYERAKKAVRLIEKALAQLENDEPTPTELNFDKERKSWNRKLKDLERKRELSQFKAPFSGELTLNFSLFKDQEEYPISTNQKIANLRSFENLQVKVKAIDPRWLNIPEDQLLLTIQSGTQLLKATFKEKRIEENRMKEEMVIIFQVAKDSLKNAKKLVGSSLTAKIWRLLDKEAYLVPKFQILLQEPNCSGENWSEDILKTFPGFQLYAEGDTHLALLNE